MFFVDIEGPDGVGKSTITKLLMDYYNVPGYGIKAEYIHFPRYQTPLGSLIRGHLQSGPHFGPLSAQLLYSIDRMEFTNKELKNLKDSADVLITDRYTPSGLTYAYSTGASYEFIYDLEFHNVAIPDLTIILTASIPSLMSRIKNDDRKKDIHETENVLIHAVTFYNNMIPNMYPNVVLVDAEKHPFEVFKKVLEIVEERRCEKLKNPANK